MQKAQELVKEHSMELKNREEMILSGVLEVINFSDITVSLKTVCGDLLIRGEKLSIGRLNTETGELYVRGLIISLRYSKSKKKNRFEGLLK